MRLKRWIYLNLNDKCDEDEEVFGNHVVPDSYDGYVTKGSTRDGAGQRWHQRGAVEQKGDSGSGHLAA